MFNFPEDWSDWTRISFMQRTILIHSFLYYSADRTLWEDKKYDEASKYLVEAQSRFPKELIKKQTQYGYVFYDFDGTTGFDLYDRLYESDKERIRSIANHL